MLYPLLRRINDHLVRWACRKYRRLRRRGKRAEEFLARVAGRFPALLAHWRFGLNLTAGRWEPCKPRGFRTGSAERRGVGFPPPILLAVLCSRGGRPGRWGQGLRSGWRPGGWPSTGRPGSRTFPEGFDFLGVIRGSPLRVQAAGCEPAVGPLRGTHRVRDAHPARLERGRGHGVDPRGPGLGGILPGAWCRPRCSTRWTPTCGGSPSSGPGGGPATSRGAGSSAGTSARSTGSGTTAGCSVTATADLVTVLVDAHTRHVMVKGTASPDLPALASSWAERRKKVNLPLDRYALRLLTRQDAQ